MGNFGWQVQAEVCLQGHVKICTAFAIGDAFKLRFALKAEVRALQVQ